MGILNRLTTKYKENGPKEFLKFCINAPGYLYDYKIGKKTICKEEELVNKVKGKRVLILGSGPSANDLKSIPEDVIIFTCNFGPQLLLDKGLRTDIELYICMGITFKRYPGKNKDIVGLLSKINLKYMVTEDKRLFENIFHKTTIEDSNRNSYYLKKIIHPHKCNEIFKGITSGYSTGNHLIQYALALEAKEIYIIGMDGGFKVHFWSNPDDINEEEKRIFEHGEFDRRFIEILSKKYNYIYSISKSSPINKYLNYKELI